MQFMQLPIVQASPQAYGMFLGHTFRSTSHLRLAQLVQQQVQQAEVQAQMDPRRSTFQMITQELVEDARVAQVDRHELNAQMLQGLMPQGHQQDPLVAIRQQELGYQGRRRGIVSARQKLDQARADALEQQKMMQQKAATDAARIESQEEIADQRATTVNMERIDPCRDKT
jgi:hypothetical protein